MNTTNTKSEINALIQSAVEFTDKIKTFQNVINENLSGGMKEIVYDKLNAIELNAKNIISILNDINQSLNKSNAKKSKKIKNPKVATDVWSLLK